MTFGRRTQIAGEETVGDFTFWFSPWLRLLDKPKTRLSWRWNKKWSWILRWSQLRLRPYFWLNRGLACWISDG